jgi:hypothetical protein
VQGHGQRLQSGRRAGQEVPDDIQVSCKRRLFIIAPLGTASERVSILFLLAKVQRNYKNANFFSTSPHHALLNNCRAVRYEDLSLSPYDITQEILQFYGLAFDERVSEFLDTHTKTNVGGVSSTFRDSKSAPFHWAKELPYNEVKYIQDSCKEAMRLWGYKEANNASELLRNFNPLLPLPDFDSN